MSWASEASARSRLTPFSAHQSPNELRNPWIVTGLPAICRHRRRTATLPGYEVNGTQVSTQTPRHGTKRSVDERGSHPPCWPARKPRSPLVPVVLNRPPSHGGPRVRIHLPPADSPSLAQTQPLPVKKRAVPRGCAPLRSAETRSTGRNRANRRCYLCRAIFQYRVATDGIGQRRPRPGPSSR